MAIFLLETGKGTISFQNMHLGVQDLNRTMKLHIELCPELPLRLPPDSELDTDSSWLLNILCKPTTPSQLDWLEFFR